MGLISDAAVSRGDIGREQAEIKRDMEAARSARRAERTSVGAEGMRFHSGGSATFEDGGGVTIGDGGNVVVDDGGNLGVRGGQIAVVEEDNTSIVLIGKLGDGSIGWRFASDQGDPFFTRQGNPGSQFWALWDSQPEIVFSIDSVSGAGIGRPYMNLYLAPSGAAVSYESLGGTEAHLYPATASTSAVELWSGRNTIWQPRIRIHMATASSIGSTANWRFLINGEDATGTMSGAGTATVEVPGWGSSLGTGDDVFLSVEGWLSGDPGQIGLMVRGCYGLQS